MIDTIRSLPPLGKSDHVVLNWDFVCKWTSSDFLFFSVRHFSKANFNNLRSFLLSYDWSPAHSLPINDAFLYIQSAILSSDELFISKTVPLARNQRPLPKFILRLINLRSILWRRYKASGFDDDFSAFKVARNKCSWEIRKIKRSREAAVIKASIKNPKILFKYLKSKRVCPPFRSFS